MSTLQQRNRYRGHNAEYALAKMTKGVVVGRSKAVVVNNTTVEVNPTAPPDVVTPIFSFECKSWLKAPASIRKVMSQAKANCPDKLIPIGAIYDRELHIWIFLISGKDFVDLHIGGS